MTRSIIAIDTETDPIGPDNVCPKLICLTAATLDPDEGEACGILFGNAQMDEIEGFLLDVLEDDEVLLVFCYAGFDLSVICKAFPQLIPLVFEKLEKGLVTDVAVRERLLNLSTHGKLTTLYAPDGSKSRINYSLADLVLTYTGEDISAGKTGDDIWRTNYDALDGFHADRYPKDAREYAIKDSLLTLEVHDLQAERILGEIGPGSVKTAEFNTAVSFGLRLMTCWGLLIDQQKVAEVEAMVAKELTPEKLSLLIEAKILTPATPEMPYANGAIDKATGLPKMRAAKDAAVKTLLLKAQVLLATLAKEKVSTTRPEEIAARMREIIHSTKKVLKEENKELLAELMEICKESGVSYKKTPTKGVCTDGEVLDSLAPFDPIIQQYQERQKLQKLVSTYLPHLRGATTIHPEFDVLKETGRTSSWASKHYPSTNIQQEDPRTRPCFIARPGHVLCSVDYSAIELCSTAQRTFNLFGFSVMRDKINAGVDLHAYLGSSLAMRMSDRGSDLFSSDPMKTYEAFLNYKQEDPAFYKRWRKFAKPPGLGLPGGMGAETFVTYARGYGVHITVEEAKMIKEVWLETYPEMRRFFDWIKTSCVDPHNIGTHPKTGEPAPLYSYLTVGGMYRAGATYCAAANGIAMQSDTAHGAKGAVFTLARECYDWSRGSILFGSRPVIFMHDETITEIREDEKMRERAYAISKIMVDCMKRVLPDMLITAEPALMRYWTKEADDPVYDDDGLLQIWEPQLIGGK